MDDRRIDLGTDRRVGGGAGPDGDVKPWPRWVRYPLIAIVVGFAVWGILTASSEQATGGGLRVAIAVGVAIVVGAVLGPIGRRRRDAREQRHRGDSEVASR